MHIAEIISIIEQMAPLQGAASWDKSGLQVACRHTEVRRLAVALDPVPATIERALDEGADFILTHHPLSPHLPNRLDNYHTVLSLLFRADAGLYAAHTSLDVQPDGPVGWLARHLCLRHPVLLEESREMREYSEGCLSVPGIYADVRRPERIKVEYYNENFEKVTEEFDRFACRMIQHEMEHLDGHLFVDDVAPIRRKMIARKLQSIAKGRIATRYKSRLE